MSRPILPINFNVPPSLPAKGDISSLANKDTVNTLNNIKPPTAFGDQSKTSGQIIKPTENSTLLALQQRKELLIQEGVQLDIDHQQTLLKLQQQNTPTKKVENGQTIDIPPQLTNEEYQQAVAAENKNYEEAKKILQERKDQNQKDIDDLLKDPFKKQKDKNKKSKNKLKTRKKKTREEQRKARKQATQAILKNSKKSLPAILALLLTNKIAEILSQNEKIQKLIDDTNAIITSANESGDQTKLSAAKTARDNAIKIIQSNEGKINAIRSQIQRISTYINIFNVIINIISLIPLPTSVPPGIGIPTSVIIKFVKILEKANKILLSLSALVPILLSSLDKAIAILQDLKSQLLDINGQLDKAATTGNTLGAVSLLSNPGLGGGGVGGGDGLGGLGGNGLGGSGFGTVSETYKGYRFALREEDNPKFNVRGFKRHYAVAIDASNVEVLKSEYSFTLDPNDLIEQLKLLIDQKGLTTGDGLSSPNGNPNPASSTNLSSQNNRNNQNSQNNQNNQNNQNSQNNQNPNLPSIMVGGVPSSSAISKLKQTNKKPPPPIVIVGPAGSGITAKIPLGIVKKAQLIAQAAASATDPRPKLDVAFIIAADTKWKSEYKKYQRSIISAAD